MTLSSATHPAQDETAATPAAPRGASSGAEKFVRALLRHGSWAAAELRRGRPRHLVHFYGNTPGDDLMCTAVLHEMRRRGARGLWMMTRFAELFAGNPDVDRVVPFDERYHGLLRVVKGRSWYAHYGGHDEVADQSPIPRQHILALLCHACGITGDVTLRPYLHLTESERNAGRLRPRQIALHSSGLSAFTSMKNKEWFPDRFQSVVNTLRDAFDLVQLGSTTDPLLDGCLDLRGKTTRRESAAIIAASEVFVGQVGFLMHLARAVNTRAVIIYGGRELPWQSGYSCNTNLVTPLPCSPCWRWNACHNPIERDCLRRISVDDVVDAVRTTVLRCGEPLEVETATVTAV